MGVKLIDERSSRVMQVPLSLELFVELIREGAVTDPVRCISGLPKNAELIDSWYSPEARTGYLLFTSDEFEEVDLGEDIPILKPVLETLDPADFEGWDFEE